MLAGPGAADLAETGTASALSGTLACRARADLPSRPLLGPGAAGCERAVGVLQMGTDEPVELLQRAGMLDEHVLRDLIQLLSGLDSLALRFDDARVNNVQGSQVLHGAGATDGVVVPAPLGHERSRCARWRPAERGDPLGALVDHAAHGVHLRVQHRV